MEASSSSSERRSGHSLPPPGLNPALLNLKASLELQVGSPHTDALVAGSATESGSAAAYQEQAIQQHPVAYQWAVQQHAAQQQQQTYAAAEEVSRDLVAKRRKIEGESPLVQALEQQRAALAQKQAALEQLVQTQSAATHEHLWQAYQLAQIQELQSAAPATRHERHEADSEKTKTKDTRRVCTYFLSNTCRRMEDCRDRHPELEECETLRRDLKTRSCKHGDGCRTPTCLYHHPREGPVPKPEKPKKSERVPIFVSDKEAKRKEDENKQMEQDMVTMVMEMAKMQALPPPPNQQPQPLPTQSTEWDTTVMLMELAKLQAQPAQAMEWKMNALLMEMAKTQAEMAQVEAQLPANFGEDVVAAELEPKSSHPVNKAASDQVERPLVHAGNGIVRIANEPALADLESVIPYVSPVEEEIAKTQAQQPPSHPSQEKANAQARPSSTWDEPQIQGRPLSKWDEPPTQTDPLQANFHAQPSAQANAVQASFQTQSPTQVDPLLMRYPGQPTQIDPLLNGVTQPLGRVCIHFLSSNCKRKRCPDRHPDPDECDTIRFDLKRRECKHGDTCKTVGCLYHHPREGPVVKHGIRPPPRIRALDGLESRLAGLAESDDVGRAGLGAAI